CGRLGRRRYPGEVLAHFRFREATELLALDDEADLDRPRVELLAFGGLLQSFETEDDGIVLGHPLFVLFLEQLHDGLTSLSDAARLVRSEGAARGCPEQTGSETVPVRDAHGRRAGPDPPPLRLVRLVIAAAPNAGA